MRRWGLGGPGALFVIALAACGEDVIVPATSMPEVLLGGTSMADTPWPSDLFLRDGKLVVPSIPLAGNPKSIEALAAALSELDGASSFTSAFFPLGEALPDGPVAGRARWIDLDDAATPAREGKLFARAETRELVALPPLVAWPEGHRIAVVVETARVRPSAAMKEALGGQGAFGSIYRGVDLGRAACATVFTVGHPTKVAEAMREVASATPPPKARVDRVIAGAALGDFFGKPTTTRPGLGDPEGIVHDAIGVVVLGSFDAPSFVAEVSPKQGFVTFAAGKPVIRGSARVPFMLTLPKRTSYAKTPAIVFQHGLNAGRAQVATPANDYARAGFATIGIDALWHADRGPRAKDVAHNFGGGGGADGLADADDFGAAINLFDFDGDAAQGISPLDARVVRDNFRQAIVDFGELARFVKRGDTTAIAAADPTLKDFSFDSGPLVYTSESFGSVIGTGAFATSPDFDGAVFSVGGAGVFLGAVPNSPLFSGLVGPFLRSSFDPTLDLSDATKLPGEAQRVLSLLQAAFAPGDPISFAPKIASQEKHALFLQARSDELIPNQSGELLALAARATAVALPARTEGPRFVTLPAAAAPWSGAPTLAFVQLVPALHTMFTGFTGERRYEPEFPPFVPLSAPVVVDNPIEIVHDLAIGFAKTLREKGRPEILAVTR